VSAATLAAIQIVIGGLLQGSLFALVALGFALVFRMTGVINLSQGAFCVLGALLCYSLQETLHLPVPLAILGAVLAALLFGLALGAAVFVPALSRLPNSSMLMLTAGLLTFIQGLMLVFWGGDPYALRPLSGESGVSAEKTYKMMDDLDRGDIDIALLWGPLAGYYATKSKNPPAVVPLVKEPGSLPMVFRIVMGVRHSDQNWKRSLNKLISENQGEIQAILRSYGVPLLDENNKPISP